MNDNQNHFSASVRKIIKKKGITITQLAAAIGKTNYYCGQLVNGGRRATPNVAEDIATALGGCCVHVLVVVPPDKCEAITKAIDKIIKQHLK